MAGPKLAPRRYCASPTNPHNMVRPPPWPAAAKESQLTPSIKMLAMSKAVVAGASFSPNKRESFLLKAAREKCRLAPHSWQRVALKIGRASGREGRRVAGVGG